jgi:LysM domain
MKKAWLKLLFSITACFFLIQYTDSLAQTPDEQPQSQEAEEGTSEPPATTDQPMQPTEKMMELPPPAQAEVVIAEHWSKNPYPRTIPAGARVHIVERGDTLWDLAQRYYNNPFLWPQIWDANNYIPNAHWIYPGDPVVIPPLSPISEEQIAKETGGVPGEPGEGIPGETGGPGGPGIPGPGQRNYPIGLDVDLYCSGFITNDADDWRLGIIGNEENYQKVAQALFDVVYLNQGEADGISPGDEFTILHKLRSIEHPVTLESLGDYVVQTGRLKVVATQERTSTAQITYSCDATLVGDKLMPFEPKEVPLMTDLPPVDRYSDEGPNPKGYVVFAKDDLGSLGEGNEVQLDLGSQDGLTVGTRLVLYRPQTVGYEGTGFEKDLPRRVLGEIVVFNVQESTATGRIIQMYDFGKVGDQVEVR